MVHVNITLKRLKLNKSGGIVMAWVAKDYIGEWIFNCKPDMWAGDCIEHN